MCCQCDTTASKMTGMSGQKAAKAHQNHHKELLHQTRHKQDRGHAHAHAHGHGHLTTPKRTTTSNGAKAKNQATAETPPKVQLRRMPFAISQPMAIPNSDVSPFMALMSTSADLLATPSKSPQGGAAYAGAKFSDPPSPTVLPRPPMKWVSSDDSNSDEENVSPRVRSPVCISMASELKMMLKVQA